MSKTYTVTEEQLKELWRLINGWLRLHGHGRPSFEEFIKDYTEGDPE